MPHYHLLIFYKQTAAGRHVDPETFLYLEIEEEATYIEKRQEGVMAEARG